MKLIIKIAGTGIILDTDMPVDRSQGSLYGVPYKITAGAELDIYRTAFKADDNTGWDVAYRELLKRPSSSKNVLRVGVPTNSGVKEFHYNPGVHTILGPTGAGKNFVLFKGMKPFVDVNPLRSSSIYSYGEDKLEGGVKLNDPEELFVELASDILDQIASFFVLKKGGAENSSGSLKNGNGYASDVIKAMSKTYDSVADFDKTFAAISPLPKVVYLDSIRDYVYSKGIQGSGGFNMRIIMEINFLKGLIEELNMHMFVTINPLVSFDDKNSLNKIESDAESSTSTVLSLRPVKLRDPNPNVNLYARGAANPDRVISELTIRNLKTSPVTAEEIKTFAAGEIVVMDEDSAVVEDRDVVTYAAESAVAAPVRVSKTYGTKAVRKVKTQQDSLLAAITAAYAAESKSNTSVNSED
jgi:hypothetical protein